MKSSLKWPAWLWVMQAVTGGLLVIYVIIHTIDNGMILAGQDEYEKMLSLWHETLPHWFYILMVIGLVGVILLHMLNGIRIASKPYKDIEVSWRHNIMLKHQGTAFWYTQVISGSAIAMFAVWHLIVQHGVEATTTAAQSAERVTPTVFIIYVLFLAAVMFHSFNGVRSVILKLGFMTTKAKEGVLVSLMTLLFIAFFFVGVLSMAKFIPAPIDAPQTGDTAGNDTGRTNVGELGESNHPIRGGDSPITRTGGRPVAGDGSGNTSTVTEIPEPDSEGGGEGQ